MLKIIEINTLEVSAPCDKREISTLDWLPIKEPRNIIKTESENLPVPWIIY